VFIAEVLFVSVQSVPVSLLRQIGSSMSGDEGRIGCSDVVTIGDGTAESLDGGPVFRSGHIQFVQEVGELVIGVLHGG